MRAIRRLSSDTVLQTVQSPETLLHSLLLSSASCPARSGLGALRSCGPKKVLSAGKAWCTSLSGVAGALCTCLAGPLIQHKPTWAVATSAPTCRAGMHCISCTVGKRDLEPQCLQHGVRHTAAIHPGHRHAPSQLHHQACPHPDRGGTHRKCSMASKVPGSRLAMPCARSVTTASSRPVSSSCMSQLRC